MLCCCLWRNVETSCHKHFVVVVFRYQRTPPLTTSDKCHNLRDRWEYVLGKCPGVFPEGGCLDPDEGWLTGERVVVKVKLARFMCQRVCCRDRKSRERPSYVSLRVRGR